MRNISIGTIVNSCERYLVWAYFFLKKSKSIFLSICKGIYTSWTQPYRVLSFRGRTYTFPRKVSTNNWRVYVDFYQFLPMCLKCLVMHNVRGGKLQKESVKTICWQKPLWSQTTSVRGRAIKLLGKSGFLFLCEVFGILFLMCSSYSPYKKSHSSLVNVFSLQKHDS